MDDTQFKAITAIVGIVSVFLVKREFSRIMDACDRIPSKEVQAAMQATLDRIPSTQTFLEWGAKLEALDTNRLNQHYAMAHEHANLINRHELEIKQHNRRLDKLEEHVYEGPERRSVPRT